MEQDQVGFDKLGLSEATLAGIRQAGFQTPSPIQAAFIPLAIAGGDCIGQAQTGTGKTAAFVLPILERIDFKDLRTQVLVLTPTRELSQQVADEAERLSIHHPVRTACCVGGRPLRQQIAQLQKGAQIVVGTPGRVIDLMARGDLVVRDLKIIVMDEADRMLDIGFRPDIEKILRQVPKERQTLLLSATLPAPVERLAQKYMNHPVRVDLSIKDIGKNSIDQYYIPVDPDRKFKTLVRLLVRERPQQAIVFTRTKRGAEEVFRRFADRLPGTAYLHGDLAQSARDRTMRKFREGRVRLLIATDVVGRGIDVSGISHIVNYDIPEDCDDYVHRVGRTGRLSTQDIRNAAFTLVCRDEGQQLTNIEMRINRVLPAYTFADFESQRPGPRRAVATSAALEHTPLQPEEEEEFGAMLV